MLCARDLVFGAARRSFRREHIGSPTVKSLEGVPRASAPTPQPLEISQPLEIRTAVGDARTFQPTSVPLSNARTQLSRLRRLTQATADEAICQIMRWSAPRPDPTAVGDPQPLRSTSTFQHSRPSTLLQRPYHTCSMRQARYSR